MEPVLAEAWRYAREDKSWRNLLAVWTYEIGPTGSKQPPIVKKIGKSMDRAIPGLSVRFEGPWLILAAPTNQLLRLSNGQFTPMT